MTARRWAYLPTISPRSSFELLRGQTGVVEVPARFPHTLQPRFLALGRIQVVDAATVGHGSAPFCGSMERWIVCLLTLPAVNPKNERVYMLGSRRKRGHSRRNEKEVTPLRSFTTSDALSVSPTRTNRWT